MDLQLGVVEKHIPQPEPLLQAVAQALAAARTAAVPVIHIRVAFRDGYPEVSPRNRSFTAFIEAGGLGESDPQTQLHPAIGSQPGDIVVTKRRTSAFAGSDLEVVLRSLGVENLILCGFATGGVVLSTVRQAADLDYRITVLSDGCADPDDRVHEFLLRKIFVRQAEVVTVASWTNTLRAGESVVS